MTTDTPDAAAAAAKPTIVLIHGLWLTPLSWEGWKQRFESKGYTVLAPAWPGLEGNGGGGSPEHLQVRAARDQGDHRPLTTGSSAASAPPPSLWATRSAALSRSSC